MAPKFQAMELVSTEFAPKASLRRRRLATHGACEGERTGGHWSKADAPARSFATQADYVSRTLKPSPHLRGEGWVRGRAAAQCFGKSEDLSAGLSASTRAAAPSPNPLAAGERAFEVPVARATHDPLPPHRPIPHLPRSPVLRAAGETDRARVPGRRRLEPGELRAHGGRPELRRRRSSTRSRSWSWWCRCSSAGARHGDDAAPRPARARHRAVDLVDPARNLRSRGRVWCGSRS